MTLISSRYVCTWERLPHLVRSRCTTKIEIVNFDSHDADEIALNAFESKQFMCSDDGGRRQTPTFFFLGDATKTICRKSQVNWAINFLLFFISMDLLNGFYVCVWHASVACPANGMSAKAFRFRTSYSPLMREICWPVTHRPIRVSICTGWIFFNMQTHQQVVRLLQEKNQRQTNKCHTRKRWSKRWWFWCIYF